MLEIRRKLIHASGILTIFLILWLGKWAAAAIILSLAILSFIVSRYRKDKKKYKIIKSKKLDEFEESIENVVKNHERPNTEPFKGVAEFFLGCFFATLLFEPRIAMASIAVLSLADATSTLIGKHYGKHRLPLNKDKTVEGSVSFFITATVALLFFVSPPSAVMTALIATFVEMIPKVDDNITIPIAVGMVLSTLKLFILS